MLRAAVAGLLLWLAAVPAWAQALVYSPDIGGVFSTVLLHDEDVANDNLAGTVTPLSLGPLPANAAVAAIHHRPNGDALFALDISTDLGGLFVTPRDVIRYDGVGYTIEFDGAANGIPDGTNIDALSEAKGQLLMSLDATANLAGVLADDEDIVAFKNGSYNLLFDGSAAGIDPSLDLDGADAAPNGELRLSFDGSHHVNHLRFDDEDVLGYDPGTGQFSLVYDGSTFQPAWAAADLEALAKPAQTKAGQAGKPGTGKGHEKARGEGHAKGRGLGHQ